jgi:hypothetical protein
MKDCGVHTICDPGRDRPLEERKLFQCVHCGYHFEMIRDSGRELHAAGMSLDEILKQLHRGWCTKCDGPYCGPECDPDRMLVHEHFMQRLERLETGSSQIIVVPERTWK